MAVNKKNEYVVLKAKFLKAYANLPEPEREQIIAIVDNKPYSWNASYREIEEDTKLGQKIIEKMRLVEIL